MLAAERRSEIGMARAVGTQRRQVVQIFVTEGMVYALAASALGVLIGIGVTFAMTRFIGGLFNNLTGQLNAQAAGLFGITLPHHLAVDRDLLLPGRRVDVCRHRAGVVPSQPHEHRQRHPRPARPTAASSRARVCAAYGAGRCPSLVTAGGVALLVWVTPDGLYSLPLLGVTLLLFGGMLLVGRHAGAHGRAPGHRGAHRLHDDRSRPAGAVDAALADAGLRSSAPELYGLQPDSSCPSSSCPAPS